MNKSVFDLHENLAAALAYVGIFFTGIVVLVMEKENKFVRFAALQSTVFFLAVMVFFWVTGVFAMIPLLGILIGLIRSLLGIGIFVIWLYLMFSAYKGQAVKLPIIGQICWDQVDK